MAPNSIDLTFIRYVATVGWCGLGGPVTDRASELISLFKIAHHWSHSLVHSSSNSSGGNVTVAACNGIIASEKGFIEV